MQRQGSSKKADESLIAPRERSVPLGTIALFGNSCRRCKRPLDDWTIAAGLGSIDKEICMESMRQVVCRGSHNHDSSPRNNRTYLVTRCVGRIASSRNEETFNGSLGLLDSVQDRYLLGSRGCDSR